MSDIHFQFAFWSIFFFSNKMHRRQPCFLEAKHKRQNSFIDLTSDSALDLKQEDLLILSFSHLKYWDNNVFPLLVCGLMKQYKNFEHFWQQLLYYHSNFPSKDREINSPVSLESFKKSILLTFSNRAGRGRSLHRKSYRFKDIVLYFVIRAMKYYIRNFICNWQLLNMHLSTKVNRHFSSKYHIFFNHPWKYLSYILLLWWNIKRETLK